MPPSRRLAIWRRLKAQVALAGRRLALARRAYTAPRAVLAAHPRWLVACTASLVCLCVMVVCWNRRPVDDSADFDLHDDISCSNLDSTSADRPSQPAEPPPQPTVVKELVEAPVPEPASPPLLPPPPPVVQVKTEETSPAPALPPPPPPTMEPTATKLEPLPLNEAAPVAPVPPPPAAEAALPELNEPGDPLVDWHRGDVPMIRNWHKVIGFPAILAAAMFAGPIATAADDNKGSSDQGSKVDWKTIKEQLDKIDTKIGSLDTIKSDLGGLKKEIELMRQANGLAFKELHERVTELEGKLKSLEARISQPPTRVSNFPPANGAAPAMGRIRLLNNYPSPATVILNNTVYRLNPMESRNVEVPAGNYSFEVLVEGFGSVQPPTTATLAANGTRTIEIFNR
jgi:hypothetical protein